MVILFKAQQSEHILQEPSFFGTKITRTAHGLMLSLTYPLPMSSSTCLCDENHETGQIQAKGPSGEGRRPKWRRTKPRVEKDEDPEVETLSRLLIVAEDPN